MSELLHLSSKVCAEYIGVVSSANICMSKYLQLLKKSFVYIMKRRRQTKNAKTTFLHQKDDRNRLSQKEQKHFTEHEISRSKYSIRDINAWVFLVLYNIFHLQYNFERILPTTLLRMTQQR